jgi:hypothetical protein
MSIGDWFRKLFAGPTHIGDGSNEDAAALHEEYGTPGEGEADLRHMEETGGGGGLAGLRFGANEAAEAAEEDLETEEAPPDLAP